MTNLGTYYEQYWQHRVKKRKLYARPPVRTQVAVSLLPQFPIRLLDLGCGEGQLGKALKGTPHQLVGVDISSTAIKLARAHYHQVIVADFTTPKGQEKVKDTFDVVTALEVIEHLIDPAALIKFAARKLNDNGQFIVSFPNTAWWKYRLDLMFKGRFIDETPTYTYQDHLHFFTIPSLTAMASSQGFWLEKVEAAYILPWYFGRLPQTLQRVLGSINPSLFGYQVVLSFRKKSHLPTVAHFIKDYLGPSENWLHTQIIESKKTAPIVLAKNLYFSSQFPANVVKYPLLSDKILASNLPLLLLRKVLAVVERIRNSLLRTEKNFYLNILKRSGTRLIHAHYGPTGFEAIPLKQTLKLPLVVSFYGSDVNSLPITHPQWRTRYRQLFGVADAIIVKGPYMRKKIIDLGCNPQKIAIIDAGIQVSHIPFRPRLPTKKPKLLVACRLVEFKGVDYAIRALKRVSHQFPGVSLIIIGNGPKLNSLRKLINSLHLNSHVHFVPFLSLSRMREEMNRHHIFLQPSITTHQHQKEGIPTTMVEAVASGMPVIATKHSDIPAVIKHQHNGLLVAEKDHRELAAAIIKLITHPQWWRRYGLYGRRLVEKHFDATKQTAKREKLYNKLLKL